MRKTGIATAFLGLLAASGELRAQTRLLEQRVDSFARIALRTASAVETHDDSVGRMARTLDTAHAGALIVLAARPILSQTRAIAPVAIESVESTIGKGMSRLTGYSFRAHVEYRVGWEPIRDTTKELVISVIRPNGAQMRAWRAPVDSASIAGTLQFAMTYTAFAVSDAAFFAWAGNSIPDDTLNASEWANQRLHLVSSTSAVGSRCFRGDIQACRVALMLTPGSNPIHDWHDSTTRRRLVRRHGALARRVDARGEQQCLAGSDADCIALLELFPAETFREPTAPALRSGLLRHAVAVGGAGSVERLLELNGVNSTARLEAAARLPMDSLIGSWRARVRDTRAPSEDLTVGITIMSLAWATGMGALSLRSSRWR
jgi:hypothetical protein